MKKIFLYPGIGKLPMETPNREIYLKGGIAESYRYPEQANC